MSLYCSNNVQPLHSCCTLLRLYTLVLYVISTPELVLKQSMLISHGRFVSVFFQNRKCFAPDHIISRDKHDYIC